MALLKAWPSVGAIHGRLTVIEFPFRRDKCTYLRCRCACGEEIDVRRDSFISGNTRSCGCLAGSTGPRLQTPSIGTVSGRLMTIGPPFRRDGYTYVRCRCSCRTETDVRRDHFITGGIQSCGCLESEVRGSRFLPHGVAAGNKVLLGYKRHARKRKLEWALTNAEFFALTSSDCHYCGAAPATRVISAQLNGAFIHNGIDRQDNRVGYTASNAVPCCYTCNHAKAQMTVQAFEAWIDQLILHRR